MIDRRIVGEYTTPHDAGDNITLMLDGTFIQNTFEADKGDYRYTDLKLNGKFSIKEGKIRLIYDDTHYSPLDLDIHQEAPPADVNWYITGQVGKTKYYFVHQNIAINNTKITQQQAIEKVTQFPEVQEWLKNFSGPNYTNQKTGDQAFIEFDHTTDVGYIIWVYDLVKNGSTGHAVTHSRYEVNEITGSITKIHPESGILDASSLNTGSAYPVITGTYSGKGGVSVFIYKGKQSLPFTDKNNSPKPVKGSSSDHGGLVATNGNTFSYDLGYCNKNPDYCTTDLLSAGTYTVGVYSYNNIYNPDYRGNTNPILIASGTLVVK